MSTWSPAWFRSLFDDAAMFPPGNAPAAQALEEHLRYRHAWFAELVGPLLVPARDWASFASAHRDAGSPELAVVVIGATEAPGDIPAAVRIVGYEAAVADVPLPLTPSGAGLAAEITPGPAGSRVIDAVAKGARDGRSVVAKYRTGGTSADAFPDEATLADVISECVRLGAAFKLTAGLHHAVRHTDPRTGFEHHGFLNVLVAVQRALTGGDDADLRAALGVRAPEVQVAELQRSDDPATVRARFVSFGCCGVEDPIRDLVELGLVSQDNAQ